MKLTFYGAAQCVPGSNSILTLKDYQLMVDCGLFQGDLLHDKLNDTPFAYDPATVNAMVLTHAHIDHSGRIPKLVKEGFSGKIYCSKATRDLAEILLLDSAKIQEQDAIWENKKRERAGLEPVKPLYDSDDVYHALSLLYPIDIEKWVDLNAQTAIYLRPTGHLLGACAVTVKSDQGTITFSGDLGTHNPILLPPLGTLMPSDVVVCESTYGNRIHPQQDKRIRDLVYTLEETLDRGGTAIIPAFSVGRTQQILYDLYSHLLKNPDSLISKFPIYVDSPLAIDATEIYTKNADWLKPSVRQHLKGQKSPFKPENLHVVHNMQRSMALNSDRSPKIIISASGMCDAGRIRHHLKHYLWRPETSLIFVGYQADGSTGRAILEGTSPINLLDEAIIVKARIYKLSGYSGHADQSDLLEWIDSNRPKTVILTHGESDAISAMQHLLEQRDISVYTPQIEETIDL